MMDFIKTVKGKIILCLVPAVLLPGIVLTLPKASALLKFLTALVPLVSFLVVYFVIKRDLHKVGIQLQGLGAEVVQKTPTDAIVVQKLLKCSKLTVFTVLYTDVVALKKSKVLGLSKSYSIYKYFAEIEGGIENMGDCKFVIDRENQEIYVQLPEPQVIRHNIKKYEKFDEKDGIFCKISNEEILQEAENRKKAAEQKFIEYGFFEQVKNRAEEVISQMLDSLGYGSYDIFFQAPKNPKLLAKETWTKIETFLNSQKTDMQ